MTRLEHKVALITGGGSGIGSETASLMASEGAKIVVADIEADSAHKTVERIRSNGGTAIAVVGDVTKAADCEAFVEATLRQYGSFSVLHNNAGALERSALMDMSEELWDRLITVNLKSVFLMTRAAVPALARCGQLASIINVGSVLGLLGTGGNAAYTAAKGGVISLTRKLALELAPMNIRVNCYCPSTVDTAMAAGTIFKGDVDGRLRREHAEVFPLRRFGSPRDIANLAVFLASDESSWMTGSVVVIDGGLCVQ